MINQYSFFFCIMSVFPLFSYPNLHKEKRNQGKRQMNIYWYLIIYLLHVFVTRFPIIKWIDEIMLLISVCLIKEANQFASMINRILMRNKKEIRKMAMSRERERENYKCKLSIISYQNKNIHLKQRRKKFISYFLQLCNHKQDRRKSLSRYVWSWFIYILQTASS